MPLPLIPLLLGGGALLGGARLVHENRRAHRQSGHERQRVTRETRQANREIGRYNREAIRQAREANRLNRRNVREGREQAREANRIRARQARPHVVPEKHIKYNIYNKAQRKLLDQYIKGERKDIKAMPRLKDIRLPSKTSMYKQGKAALSDLLSKSPEAYKRYREQAIGEFKRKVIPEIKGAFVGPGAPGTKSSGFQNALFDAATMLEENLNAQKASMRASAIGPALTYAQQKLMEKSGLRQMAEGGAAQALSVNPFLQQYVPEQYHQGIPYSPAGTPNFAPTIVNPAMPQVMGPMPVNQGGLHRAIGAFGGPVMAGIGYGIGGPIGGAIGGGVGNMIGGWFGGGGGGGGGGMPVMPQRVAMPNFLFQ